MIQLYDGGAYLVHGTDVVPEQDVAKLRQLTGKTISKEEGRKGTIAYSILKNHNTSGSMEHLKIKFDAMASHDITFVGIIQTAKASGMEKFPLPYVLTNCHNSLCAVGGTINEDDHVFGLSAAKKYGGIFVPPHVAVIHQYMREKMAGCGRMIIGSDSHTRYGALGTMAVGEGGGELVKQLLCDTYDIAYPGVVGVYLTGKPSPAVGPHDIAIAIVGAVFKNGYVKNKVMEFVGPGIGNLSEDFRIGIDVMTTETTCLSSIWRTDERTKQFFEIHGRRSAYKELSPGNLAYYDGCIRVDLSKIRPMIAMPFHPSNVYPIEEVQKNLPDVLHDVEERAKVSFGDKISYSLQNKIRDGKLYVDQGIIAGCAGGGFENICAAADILDGHSIGNNEFTMSVYPASMPIYMELIKDGRFAKLIESGCVVKTAFCGPCFGAGDTPANGAFSIRHSTRNFPNREGSKVQNGQIASVALMDARSIAATAANKGFLTAATEMDVKYSEPEYFFDKTIYENRVFNAWGKAEPDSELVFGPNIKDWPAMSPLPENLLLRVVSEIHDPVTTTDELIPSGETSSYRSNPLGLAEFTLSRKDPAYVPRAKEIQYAQKAIASGHDPAAELEKAEEKFGGTAENRCGKPLADQYQDVISLITEKLPGLVENFTDPKQFGVGSTIFAVKPGDGSAREQAASCQKVLGGWANIAFSYATKRYRSNLINWGMLPLLIGEGELPFKNGDWVFLPDVRAAVAEKRDQIMGFAVKGGELKEFYMTLGELTGHEREIIMDGCLINYNRKLNEQNGID